MGIIKRTILYLSRKKGKTISTFLLIFIISSFLLSCFSILRTTENISKDMRTSVGAAFYLRSSKQISTEEGKLTKKEENSDEISEKVIREIINNGKIKYYNAHNSGYVKSKSLSFLHGYGHSNESNMGQVSALNSSALETSFLNDELDLIEGRHITHKDKNKILISKQLADNNHLSVGDKITLTHAKLEKKDGTYTDAIKEKTAYVEVEIVGIYNIINNKSNPDVPTAGQDVNKIFSDHHTLINLRAIKEGFYTGDIAFYIEDPLNLNKVVSEVKGLNSIDWSHFFVHINDFEYEKISESLKGIQDLTYILLICVCMVSIIILILVLTMRIRGRVQEAGILLSIGVSKKEIIWQFILEILIVSLIAFLCSFLVSSVIAGLLESSILHSLNPIQIERYTLETGIVKTASLSNKLSINFLEVMSIFIVQVVVILIAVLASSMAIIRLNPREVLSKMS